jgi:hypothetical protein
LGAIGPVVELLGLTAAGRSATTFGGGGVDGGLASGRGGLGVELELELGSAIAWSRLESFPRAPIMDASSDPGVLAEEITAYYWRTTAEGQTWRTGYELAEATIPDGYVRQGGFLFANLARPILLLRLVEAWDALDVETTARLTRIDRSDTAALVAKLVILGPVSLLMDRVAPWDTWDALELEHKQWLERKEIYRQQILAAIARDPWDPTGLSELFLDPVFTGWRVDRPHRCMPDLVAPLVLARAVDVSVEAWKEASRLFGRDLRDASGVDTLARLIRWVKSHPVQAAAYAVGGLAVMGLAPAIAQGAVSGMFQRRST